MIYTENENRVDMLYLQHDMLLQYTFYSKQIRKSD